MHSKNNKMHYRQFALPVITILALMAFFLIGQAMEMQSMGFAFVAAGLSGMVLMQVWRNARARSLATVSVMALGDK